MNTAPEPPIEWVEIRPDVWKVAPEDVPRMEAQLEAALAKAGLPSLESLRESLPKP